jgi:hypothetical protein
MSPAENRPIHRVNPLESTGWDAALAASPAASFFHGSAWARVLCDTYGFRPFYFVLGDDPSRAQGLLPMREINSWLTGIRGVSLPFTDECEPLENDPGAFQALFQAALACAQERGWKYLECRGGQTTLASSTPSTSFLGHRLELHQDEAALFARTESSTKRAVRKAEQGGLTVEFSRSLEAVRAFYGLLRKTRRRHGLPSQPFRFFQNIHRHVLAPNHGCVALVRHAGKPVAGAVFFHSGKMALYKFGASDERYQHLRANNLAMWEAIKWHAREGFTALDFGRTSLGNAGLRRFKLGWGTQERRIDYIRYDCRARSFVSARDEASGWHNRIFRVLPAFLSGWIGAALYKHVA